MLESQAVSGTYTLILASNSPRRKQLLALSGWAFDVVVADVDESLQIGETPDDYVIRLAQDKARKTVKKAYSDAIIIAADTIVVNDGNILGKPQDEVDAVRILKKLRGRTHQVYTGLALLRTVDGFLVSDLTVTDVQMRPYSDTEITAYVKSGDPLDKAGAYAIQHLGFHPVEHLTGCFASVMGLPLCRLVKLFQKLDISPKSAIDINCQNELGYDCPVSHAILHGETLKN